MADMLSFYIGRDRYLKYYGLTEEKQQKIKDKLKETLDKELARLDKPR